MPKQAILVEVNILTRVVVDLPEGPDLGADEHFEKVGRTAFDQIRHYMRTDPDYPYLENITDIKPDTEVPYSLDDRG